MSLMRIETRSDGDIDILVVSGDITLGAAGATLLSERIRSLIQRARLRILLELNGVRYVDSVGLGELIHACVAARVRGGSIKLVGLPTGLLTLLAATNLLGAFECFESEAEAVASFGPRLSHR
jgi:anti-sigma B factor antagonist